MNRKLFLKVEVMSATEAPNGGDWVVKYKRLVNISSCLYLQLHYTMI